MRVCACRNWLVSRGLCAWRHGFLLAIENIWRRQKPPKVCLSTLVKLQTHQHSLEQPSWLFYGVRELKELEMCTNQEPFLLSHVGSWRGRGSKGVLKLGHTLPIFSKMQAECKRWPVWTGGPTCSLSLVLFWRLRLVSGWSQQSICRPLRDNKMASSTQKRSQLTEILTDSCQN